MKAEKILLLFVAVIIGLCVAGIGFYLYENSKLLPDAKSKTITLTPSVAPTQAVYLTVDSPTNESTTDTKIVRLTGKTTPDATILISTDASDQVIPPASTGTFSTTVTLDSGENFIHVFAISSSGQESEKDIIVTYTTENF